MSRLVHSNNGFIRSMQISSAKFFAFVEGGLDRAFFDRVVEKCLSKDVKYQIFAIKELPPGVGGKPTLLSKFKELRQKKMLKFNAFGKNMSCVFFADKDVDDFCKKKLRSNHLIYTSTYDIEGFLIENGDFHRALSDALGITLDQAKQIIPNKNNWIKDRVIPWKEWVALCMICQIKKIKSECTFDSVSKINDDHGQLDQIKLNQYKTFISQRIGIGANDFELIFDKTLNTVNSSLIRKEYLKYFKGKWFSHIFQQYLQSCSKPADTNTNGAGERLILSLLSQVCTKADCYYLKYYYPRIIETI